jgi:surface polysaccharide O-acyltransferase-like enzyme
MEQSWRFCSVSVAMTVVALFLIFKKINCSGALYKVVAPVSKASYGIYLMHMFVLMATFSVVSGWGLATPWTILLSAGITFVVCSVVAVAISKLPGGKYIVG